MPLASVKRNWAPGCGRSFRTISRLSLGQPLRQSPSSSATQAPSRISPSGSRAGVQADAGTFRTAWWMASVMVMPTEYDSHRPRRVSQATNSWVPPPESVRISVCRPRRSRFGSWARASLVASMWSAAVLEPALPGRSKPTTGSPDPSRPWSTIPISGWCPNVFFQVAVASCFSECARTRTPSMSTITCPLASGAASPANRHTCSRTSARAVRSAARTRCPPDAGLLISRETVGSEATGPNTAGSARSRATSARQSPPSATASATSSRILPRSCTARGLRHGSSAADIAASRPVLRTVSTSSTAPVCETTPRPRPSMRTRG